MSAPTPAPTPLSQYDSVTTLIHYALGIGGLFGIGGAFALGGVEGQLVSVGIGTLSTLGGLVLQSIKVNHKSAFGQVLDKLEKIHDAVTTAPSS